MREIYGTFDKAERLPEIRRQIAHRADRDYPFLHDTMIAELGGRILLAWYNCSENEIAGRTVIRGRWSADEGKTWSEPEIIAEDAQGRHMVPVTFLEYEGEIRAYVTVMIGHDLPVGYACIRYENGKWIKESERPVPVLFNTIPVRYGAEWLMGGRIAEKPGEKPLIPVVAWSEIRKNPEWKIERLTDERIPCPETTLLVDEKAVIAVTRNENGSARVFERMEGISGWKAMDDAELPMMPVKMCGGRLPDGRQYLIYNEITEERKRNRLVLAIRNGSGEAFEKAWILADGEDSELMGGPYWHYPCTCVCHDSMYISCTSSSDRVERSAAVFTVPLQYL